MLSGFDDAVFMDVGTVCRLETKLDRGSHQYIGCPAADQHQDDSFSFCSTEDVVTACIVFDRCGSIRPGTFEALQTMCHHLELAHSLRVFQLPKDEEPKTLWSNLLRTLIAPRGKEGARD